MTIMNKYVSVEKAIAFVKPGDKLFIQTAPAAPQQLIKALAARANNLNNITIYQMHTEGDAPYAAPGKENTFNVNCFFIGANLRKAVQEGRAQYISVFLSEIPTLFRQKIIQIDVALIHVSTPDEHGYCSLGVSVEIAPAVLETAKYIIAQVNPNMPRTTGDSFIRQSKIDAMVAVNDNILEAVVETPDETDYKITDYVASSIKDGATLQMGIGKIPNAVLNELISHRRLGIHTGMFSDGFINLIEEGIIAGEMKKTRRYKVVSSFMMGTKLLYNFVHNNPMIEMLDIAHVNATNIIRKNRNLTAINSALEVDITGQVWADSIGSKMYSGVGGQIDFMRGASLSEGRKPIIALRSVTNKGLSKIVSVLKLGVGAVTIRAHVHYVVTEYGIAHLYGKNLFEGAKALIKIAHPAHRQRLEKDAHEIAAFYKHQILT